MSCEICGSRFCPGCVIDDDNFDPEFEDYIDSLIQSKETDVQYSE